MTRLLRYALRLGVPMPQSTTVEVLTADATEIRPLERRVDCVLRIRPEEGQDGSGLLLAVEAQGRKDPAKPGSWAYYLAFLREKYGCPVLLLVTCQDQRTARWASRLFQLGPEGWRTALAVHPIVLGPDNVPVVTNVEQASQDLAFAALSAMTHGNDPDITVILEALASALGSADGASVEYFTELLEIGLGDTPARTIWRKLMSMGTYFPGRGTIVEESYLKGREEAREEYLTQGLEQGREQGREQGLKEGREQGLGEVRAERVRMILRILDVRDIAMTPRVHSRITDCTDLDVVSRWLDRAFTATEVTDLFDED